MRVYALKPRCSLIVLTYNQQNYVYDAVKSALAQTGEPVEIIISDDASTDNTFKIIQYAIKGYKGSNKIVVNRNKKNTGLIPHINKIVGIATGEIIIPSYGDDISFPNRSSRILAEFNKYNPLFTHSLAIPINKNGEKVKSKYTNAIFFKTVNPKDISTSLSHYLGASGAWHRDLFEKYGPIRSEAIYDDHILGFRAALEKRVRLINEPLLYYREGVGISHSRNTILNRNKNQMSRKKILRQTVSVYTERLEDALNFGLEYDDPVISQLERALTRNISRLSYYQSTARKIKLFTKNPIVTLKAIIDELLRDLRRR
mgnify:CR=1 FL=1